MYSLLYFLSTAIFLVFGTLTFLYAFLPHYLFKFFINFSRMQAGLRRKEVKIGNKTYSYSEGGRSSSGQTLLCIHGFSSDKDMWIGTGRKLLKKGCHIVCIDLPGHGGSSHDHNESIEPVAFADRIHEFVEHMDLKNFHLVGISLGGLLAGVYCSKYPERVNLVSFVCPGMKSPIETEFLQKLRNKECALVTETPEELREMFKLILHHPVKVPIQLVKGMLHWRKPYNEFYNKVVEGLAEEDNGDLLVSVAKDIDCPSQVIWGRCDAMLHVSGAEHLRDHLPNCRRVDIIDRCGHSVMLDRPGAFVKALTSFRADMGLH